ncbi:Oidioi.mRNA.OKI2018_I69.PAR.g10136.t1.cds [Oikopleura dioica]|uniref:Oidioi.mRNA.OKI2018_I69.PAR.g10136.t1.cds n=1 Tax=Oikopleura dioica TaxID=34765 RepID=A0ABN7RP19_OIKDI|nr:Oidioi.mRNA.OKI2018_I69.PAR.g10136.t1.cds [Oikopleura dioica]
MGRVKLSKEERFVQKYLKRNGHLEVLKVFERGLEEKGKKVERQSKKASSEEPKTQARKKLEEKTQKKKVNDEIKEENESSTSNGAIKP